MRYEHLAEYIVLVAVILTIIVMLFTPKGEDRIVKEALKEYVPDILKQLDQTALAVDARLPEGSHVEAIHLIVQAENGGVHSIVWKLPETKR